MEYYVISRKGSRKINEDFAGVAETDRGFSCILADGLGGHDRGEVASALVTNTGLELFKKSCDTGGIELKAYLEHCFTEGQNRLMQMQKEKNSEMKTTMVVLASIGTQIQWGHIGDSRLYQFQNGKLLRRTLDHSVPQMLVMTGEIKEKEIRGHEDRNRLLRVMGSTWNTPQYEIAEVMEAKERQAYLLCSDGFWELLEEKQMLRYLRGADSPKVWLERMEQEILNNGHGRDMDNYTAIGVFLGKKAGQRKLLGLFS